MNDYVTLTQLSTTFGVARAAIAAWLVEIGLRTSSGTPTEKAMTEGFCKTLPGMALWHRERTIAALSKLALTTMISTVRPFLGWTEIQEVMIAMKAKEQGIEVREL